MVIDPVTLSAIGAGVGGLGKGLGQALSPAPAYSAADSTAYQAGVQLSQGDFVVVGGGTTSVFNGSVGTLSPKENVFDFTNKGSTNTTPQSGISPQILLILAAAGVLLWLMLK